MGGPSAAGVPVVLTVQPPPTLSFSLAADELTITWPAEAAGYVLESSLTLEAGSWSDVPGVSGNSATVPTTGDAQFYRLRSL